MTIQERQIKALKATLVSLKKEYKERTIHIWDSYTCPLCKELSTHGYHRCPNCPFDEYDGCVQFFEREYQDYTLDNWDYYNNIHILDIASIIYQMILYLEGDC